MATTADTFPKKSGKVFAFGNNSKEPV